MNKHFLKRIRDNMPEQLKMIFAPVFRKKLINNSFYNSYLSCLKLRENKSVEEIRKEQFENLKDILVYANKNVPYYQVMFKEIGFDPYVFSSITEIQKIPFLTKELIRENFKQLTSTEKVSGGFYEATTGGSTGEPLKVLLDYDCVFKENAFINYFRSKLGYKHNDKLATFRGVEFGNKLWKYNPMQNELIFSPFKLSNNNLKKYVAKINDYKPDFINGYLSSIYLFARLLYENGVVLNFNIKGIFLISENIDVEQRNFIESFFKVKSSTFYGHSERCIIAEEVEPNLYAFDPSYGYTELINNNDNTFSIVGTGFLNKTMPLIRYKTDDVAIKEVNSDFYCIDGSRKSTRGLYGFNDEFFTQAAFNFHSDIFKNVTGYQFIQKEKGKVNLLITVNKEFQTSEIKQMHKEIKKKTKGVIEFEITVVENLVLSKRGKFKMFISDFQ